MWLEGYSIPQNVEANDYTKEFFAKNENLNKEHTYDPLLVNDPEDNDKMLDHCTNPWLRVDGIEMDHEGILAEAMHLLDTACFTYHRPQSAGWMSLCIHGISTVHTNCADDYGLPDDYEETDSHWTDIAKFCPKTVDFMENHLNYEDYTRVRFMVLLPGGWIGPHTDKDRQGFGATNIAVNNPDGCALVMEDWGTMPFEPGAIMKINTAYNHSVWNRSNTPRIHMIVDGGMGDDFKDKCVESYKRRGGMLNI